MQSHWSRSLLGGAKGRVGDEPVAASAMSASRPLAAPHAGRETLVYMCLTKVEDRAA